MKQVDYMSTSTHGTDGPNREHDAPDGTNGSAVFGTEGDGWVEDYDVNTGDSGDGFKFLERIVPGVGGSGINVDHLLGDGKGAGK